VSMISGRDKNKTYLLTTIYLGLLFLLSTTGVAAQDVTEISNVQELQNMEDNLDGDYILVDDINASGFDFEPIGEANITDTEAQFTGSFDGNGHTISNLSIDRPNESGVGLFGGIWNASVKDVRLEDVEIIGESSVGGVVGFTFSQNQQAATEIDGVHVTGEVHGKDAGGLIPGNSSVGGIGGQIWSTRITDSSSSADVTGEEQVGGLIGIKSGGTITRSHATGNVSGNEDIGGLVGVIGGTLSESTKINKSYATGSVSGGENVGGLVGRSVGEANSSFISKSYATGSVSGEKSVGGLIGEAAVVGDDSPVEVRIINKSYATGNVSGEESVGGLLGTNIGFLVKESYAVGSISGEENVGGLIGADAQELPDVDEEVPETEVESSYWDFEATGQEESEGGRGLTTDEMTGEAAREKMDGFDFEETWTTSDSYPRLAPQVDNFSTGREEEGLPGFGILATIVASICAALLVFGRRHVRARGSTASEEEER